MNSVFRNKNQAFWVLQCGGWLAYGLIRLSNGLALGEQLGYAMVAGTAMLTGFILTLGLRSVYRAVRNAPPTRVLIVVFISCVVAAMILSPVETVVYFLYYAPLYQAEDLWYFGNAMMEAFVLFAWSSIYFGVTYIDQLQKAREQALKASTMAHQAQLKMLRYQLNPHFLFNTLNAISTLVLDKDSANANGMLGRLSSFLRYTLVNQPTQKVTLDQEMHALGLYLDIEKVRFEDRLEITREIDEDARKALMPSLLLQPLIENAIKYAIAPAEDGGKITISGRREGGRLVLEVRDNGPGLDDDSVADPKLSSGVGIANTRERLSQIYPDDHSFELRNCEPSGLSVTINIPFESEDGSGNPE